MTVDEMIALASRIAAVQSPTGSGVDGRDLARAVLDLLGEGAPCGWERPFVLCQGPRKSDGFKIKIPASWGAAMPPDDGRACARMILRACDEAEADHG